MFWLTFANNIFKQISLNKNDCILNKIVAKFLFTEVIDDASASVHPLRVKFFRRNRNIYLHSVPFIHIDKMQVVEILPQTRQESRYPT